MNNRLPFYFLTLGLILLSSCGNNYSYWDISQFNIDNSALEDGEEIKLLYTSRGPDNNKDLEYYIHVIVMSQKSGDTVNLLTMVDNGFRADDKYKTYNYLDQNNPVTKAMQIRPESLEDVDAIRNVKPKEIHKVARDPKFDFIADNSFPTVIGSIGSVSK